MAKFNLLRKGDLNLARECTKVQFPLSSEVYDCIDECKNTIRKVDGFYEKKGMAISAP